MLGVDKLVKGGGGGIAFLVSSGVVFEIIAYSCSSPQTAELNIGKREATLMKWVHIGQAQSIAFVAIAATIDKQHRGPILAGGITAMLLSESLYAYARYSGLNNPGEGTEQY
jgi:hypothetical protein